MSVPKVQVRPKLDALRKPVEGVERPDVEKIFSLWRRQAFFIPSQAKTDFDTLQAYILALEADNARLRAALRAANDPTHGHPDETDDRALDAGVGGAR